MKLCGFEAGLRQPFFLIAGPCAIESRELAFDTAGALQEITSRLGIPFIYKSSFDKANRSSGKSFRGPGMAAGLGGGARLGAGGVHPCGATAPKLQILAERQAEVAVVET